jgi:hypothetical protein
VPILKAPGVHFLFSLLLATLSHWLNKVFSHFLPMNHLESLPDKVKSLKTNDEVMSQGFLLYWKSPQPLSGDITFQLCSFSLWSACATQRYGVFSVVRPSEVYCQDLSDLPVAQILDVLLDLFCYQRILDDMAALSSPYCKGCDGVRQGVDTLASPSSTLVSCWHLHFGIAGFLWCRRGHGCRILEDIP